MTKQQGAQSETQSALNVIRAREDVDVRYRESPA
jgi:hypothetical protein